MATKKTPKFQGVDIVLDGETYVLPPLPIKAFSKGNASEKIKRIQDEFREMEKSGGVTISQEGIADLVSLVTLALQRNYPALTEEIIEDGCADVITLFGMFQYLIAQNDIMKAEMEKARKNALRAFVEKKETNK